MENIVRIVAQFTVSIPQQHNKKVANDKNSRMGRHYG